MCRLTVLSTLKVDTETNKQIILTVKITEDKSREMDVKSEKEIK